VLDVNDLVVNAVSGNAPLSDLQSYMLPEVEDELRDFFFNRLPRLLSIPANQAYKLKVSVQYIEGPSVTEDSDLATVESREAWTYASNANSRTVCETRDYRYRLIKVAGAWKLISIRGTLVSSRCE